MSNSVDTMKNFFNVLKLYSQDATTSGITILDHAVRTVSHFAGLQDAVNHFVSDMANVTATAGATQSLLQNCGIVLGADDDYTVDTGAVSGYNAGMGVLKDAQSIVPEPDVNLSEMPLPAEGSTTVHSCTGADGNTFYFTTNYPASFIEVIDIATAPTDVNPDYASFFANSTYLQADKNYYDQDPNGNVYGIYSGQEVAEAILTLIRGVENFWAEQTFKLAYDSFGLDFSNKNLLVRFAINEIYASAETEAAPYDPAFHSNLPANDLEVIINAPIYATIDPDNPNGKAGENFYVDRLLAHEMIHAVMYATGTLKTDMPEFFTEGVADLVQGDDDYKSSSTAGIAELAESPDRLAAAMSIRAGTGTSDCYAAGHMFLRYLCKQSQPAQVSIANGTPENFNYAGGEKIISGAGTGSQITTSNGVRIKTASALGDDMFVFTSAGNVIVRDVRDKVINFANESGEVYGHAYLSSTAGTIDGRTLSGYEFISGANFADNEIFAGDGGSQLWGGDYGTDILHGGNGADNFITGTYCGNDTIFNADAEDTIYLSATSLEQIVGSAVNGNGVALAFSDGSFLTVAGNVGAKFTLANGASYRADQSSGAFIDA